MNIKHLYIGILAFFLLLAACGDKSPIEETMSENVPSFSYTTQDNESFGSEDLEGKWWVADFIFTNCTTICIPMTNNMAILQDEIEDAGLDGDNFHLVSFSIDPDYDSPEVLTEYADMYGVNLDNWTFLTGYDFETIKELSIKTFRSLIKEPQPGDDQVMHGTRFFLVNPDGEIIKSYDGSEQKEIDHILEDLEKVL